MANVDETLRLIDELFASKSFYGGQASPASNILQTKASIPEAALDREMPRELWLNYKDNLKNELNSVAYTSLMHNIEVKNYPDLATHIAGVLVELLDNYANFLIITGISYDSSQVGFYTKGMDLTALGSYADFIAGKMAAGGSEISTAASARGWYFLYRDFANGKSSAYSSIMARRISAWEGAKVAPMWFWFANTVVSDLVRRAYPKNAPVTLYKDLVAEIEAFLDKVNKDLQLEESKAIEINIIVRPPEIDFSKYVPEAPEFKTDVSVVGAGGVRITNLDYAKRMLESGAWIPTKAYTRRIGGEDVIVAELLVPRVGKQRQYSGFRLEFR